MITQKELIERFEYFDGHLFDRKSKEMIGSPNGDNRWKTRIDGQYYYIHRLIWQFHFGDDVPPIVDHADRDTWNNRVENLRAATAAQSSANRTQTNPSGFKGVDRYGKRWRARIKHEGLHIHIGYFNTPEEASEAYQRKAVELHGEFATLTVKESL
jgi:hypothetical protein